MTDQGRSISDWIAAIRHRGDRFDETTRVQLKQELEDERTKHDRLFKLRERNELPIYDYREFAGGENLPEDLAVGLAVLEGFAIRAVPNSLESSFLAIERAQGLSSGECKEFVERLPAPLSSYKITVNSYFKPEWSGTIVVAENGAIVELVRGEHYRLNQQMVGCSEVYGATLRAPEHHFVYGCDIQRINRIMWQAVSFLRNSSEPISAIDFLSQIEHGYFEFVYHSEFGYRFIDVRHTQFWCTLPFDTL